MGHQNSKRHKAKHGGYKKKPSLKQVNANLEFWFTDVNKKNKEKLNTVDEELDNLFNSSIKTGKQLSLFNNITNEKI